MTPREAGMEKYIKARANTPGTIEYCLTHPLYTFLLRYTDGAEGQCDQLRFTLRGAKRFALLLAKNMSRHTRAATYAAIVARDQSGAEVFTVPVPTVEK